MTKIYPTWTAAWLLILSACKQPAKPLAQTDTIKKQSVIEANAPKTFARQDSTIATDCPRGAAEPVLKKAVFPNAQFVFQPDKRTGIEKVTLPDGDRLSITQSGCEYYMLTFQFETSHFAADTTDMAYWGNTALSLMRDVNKGLNTPLDINAALSKLSGRLKDNPDNSNPLKLGDEIDFGGPDPRQYLVVNRIHKLANQNYLLELSFNYGPI